MTLRAIISTEPSRLQWSLFGALGVGLIVLALSSGGYIVTLLGFTAIYGLFVAGLNIFMGYAGQVSFGQNAFAAVGGYGTAIMCGRYGLDPALAMIAATALSCLLAVIIGFPTLRLHGHYLAMATFALGLIAYEVAVQWTSLTGGYTGIAGIPGFGIAGYYLHGDRMNAAFAILALMFGLWMSFRLKNSRFGRALHAVARSEDAARALGIAVMPYKLAAFVIAAAYASVAGSLIAHFIGFLSPEVFGNPMLLAAFTMIYLGGIGTVFGPVLGALAVTILPEVFRGLSELQDIAYSSTLIFILIFAPKGIMGLIHRFTLSRAKASTSSVAP